MTPGTSRERPTEANAVIGLEWMCWALCRWCGAEDKADEARMHGSKCFLRCSNSRVLERNLRVSGVGLKRFVLLDAYGVTRALMRDTQRTGDTCGVLGHGSHFRRVPAATATVIEPVFSGGVWAGVMRRRTKCSVTSWSSRPMTWICPGLLSRMCTAGVELTAPESILTEHA
jgi:hypothetical protein